MTPSAKNHEPSFFTCQRRSSARPDRAASAISASGTPAARSSAVKRTLAGLPITSSARQPVIRSAPPSQARARPSGSVMMKA